MSAIVRRSVLMRLLPALIAICIALASLAGRPALSDEPAAGAVKVGDEIVIAADGPGGRLRGCQAVARGKDQYLVVWREGWVGAGGASRIFAARLDPDGKLLDRKAIEITPAAKQRQDRPRVAFCGDSYLVVWQEFNGRDMDVYGAAAIVGTNGQVGQPVTHACVPRPNVVWSDTEYLVWGGPTGAFLEMTLQRVGANGQLVGQGWKRFGSADSIGTGYAVGGAVHTSVARRPGHGWLMLCDRAVPDFWGWGGPGALRAYAIQADGKLDATQPKETHPKAGQLQPNWVDVVKGDKEQKTWPYARNAVTWDGRQFVAMWTVFHFGATGADLINGDLMLARIDGWKSREGMTPIAVAATPTNELNPAVATDGAGTLLCVYEKQPDDARANMVIAARLIRTSP